MQNKRSLKTRLLVIYVVYFIALIAGFAYNVIPSFRNGADLGADVGSEMAESWLSGSHRTCKIFMGVPTVQPNEYASIELGDEKETTVTALASKFDIVVSQKSDDSTPFAQAMTVVGGSPLLYVLSLLLLAIYIAIFIFIFLIIHSLRKSISDDMPLDNRCTWYTRIIGILIIAAAVGDAAGQWYMNSEAAKLLAGSALTVNTVFPLNYWNILIAILVIFTAEVFSIGSQLGEEQKFTI